MAGGASIARRVVDVEHRWLFQTDTTEASVVISNGRGAGFAKLQTRKLISNDHGETTWSDWIDVPIVTEDREKPKP